MRKLLDLLFDKLIEITTPTQTKPGECVVCKGDGMSDFMTECSACEGTGYIKTSYEKYLESLEEGQNEKPKKSSEAKSDEYLIKWK